MAPVCTHRLRVEGLDPTLRWASAHTHLNKQLSHVVMRDARTERHGSAAASWRHARARDAKKSPLAQSTPKSAPRGAWLLSGTPILARGLRWIAAGLIAAGCAHPLITEDESQQRTIPRSSGPPTCSRRTCEGLTPILLQHFNIFWICVQRDPVASKQGHQCVSVGDG